MQVYKSAKSDKNRDPWRNRGKYRHELKREVGQVAMRGEGERIKHKVILLAAIDSRESFSEDPQIIHYFGSSSILFGIRMKRNVGVVGHIL